MDDPHRKPGDRDRSQLAARVKRAAEQGRISAADRDIRLGNVASAHSMSELDLMSRELDQLEATLQAGTTAAAWAAPSPMPVGEDFADKAVDVAKSTARSMGVVVALVLALVLAGAGASAFFVFRAESETGSNELFEPEPIPTAGSDEPVAEPSTNESPRGAAYRLTGPGIRAFIAEYRTTFDTTMVVDLVMYDDYVIVNVPQAGKKRHAGFLYRPTSGWEDFGGVSANFPGAQLVDLRRLDVPALVRNIARARSSLDVEDPTTTYAIVRHYTSSDEAPSVDIHVSNEFRESGYLATTLDGTVERAYPFSQ